jgi:hypothetical protein
MEILFHLARQNQKRTEPEIKYLNSFLEHFDTQLTPQTTLVAPIIVVIKSYAFVFLSTSSRRIDCQVAHVYVL